MESKGIPRESGGGTQGMKSQNPREESFKKDEIRQSKNPRGGQVGALI